MQRAMPQIETIVMLMLENRSLDTVLGWLYHDKVPNHVYPARSEERFDGIPAGVSNHCRETSYQPSRGTLEMDQPCRVPRWDPNEVFEHVVKQLYADGNGTLPAHPWSTTPPMTGFACDFDAFYTTNGEVMGAYDQPQLPVLYGLAENFAVSDRWFASVPTQTNANRAFSICGTSLGGVDNGSPPTYPTKTIFNALTGTRTWGIYWQWDGFLSGDPGPREGCYTADIFPQIRSAVDSGEGLMQPYSTFLKTLAAGGDVPEFCYLEPFWGAGKGYPNGNDFIGVQGNDYHPPAWIGPSEHDLNVLYDALRTSKQWPNMLFIITFDEHGGSWDHVPPTKTVAPDANVATFDSLDTFDFTTLGVRVPTLLVSPFVAPGTVFRAPTGSKYDFDHTSFVATILKWAGIDPAGAGLGDRVAVAPTFEAVLSDIRCHDSPSFTVPTGYADQGGGKGLHPGLHLLDVDPSGMSIQDFRHVLEHSATVEHFVANLRDLARRPSSG